MPDLTSAHIGARIRRLRLEAKLSQTELAGDELSPSYVSLIESGKRTPSDDAVRLLVRRLGCQEADILDGWLEDRRRRIELELAYARLARRHGERGSALERLVALVGEGNLDPASRDEAEYELAVTYEVVGDLDAALDHVLPLLERCLAGSNAVPLTAVGVVACGCLLRSGDAAAAFRLGERALAATLERDLEGTDEHLELAATVLDAQFMSGELDAAAARARELVDLAMRAGGPGGQAGLLWNAAIIAEARGQLDEAVRLSTRALGLMSEQGGSRDLPRLQCEVAAFLLSADATNAREAVALLDAAFPTLQDLGSTIDLGCWKLQRARAELALGNPVEAELAAREAVQRLDPHKIPEAVRAHIVLGDCLAVTGHSDQAVVEYSHAAEALRLMPATRHQATLWRDLGDRRADQGDPEQAVDAYRRALDLAGIRAGSPLGDPAGHSVTGVPPVSASPTTPRVLAGVTPTGP